MTEDFQNSAQVILALNHNSILQKIFQGIPLTGLKYRGLEIEGMFVPESDIIINTEMYSDYTFVALVLVNDLFRAVAWIEGVPDSVILPEVTHAVTHAGKVIFAGIAE